MRCGRTTTTNSFTIISDQGGQWPIEGRRGSSAFVHDGRCDQLVSHQATQAITRATARGRLPTSDLASVFVLCQGEHTLPLRHCTAACRTSVSCRKRKPNGRRRRWNGRRTRGDSSRSSNNRNTLTRVLSRMPSARYGKRIVIGKVVFPSLRSPWLILCRQPVLLRARILRMRSVSAHAADNCRRLPPLVQASEVDSLRVREGHRSAAVAAFFLFTSNIDPHRPLPWSFSCGVKSQPPTFFTFFCPIGAANPPPPLPPLSLRAGYAGRSA